MEWVVGIFILWLIGILSVRTRHTKKHIDLKALEAQKKEDIQNQIKRSKTTLHRLAEFKAKQALEAQKKKEDVQKANSEVLVKRLDIDLDGASSKNKRKITRRDISADLPFIRQTFAEEQPQWSEVPPWFEDDSCSCITKKLNQYGVASIWHMTHKDNIREIVSSGILSNKIAYETKNPLDISDQGVQRWRELKDPIYGRKIHEYAPTYINIKNPMLYVRRNIWHDLCLIEISLSALSDNNFIFTDGNAAARNTNFYNETNDLDKLPWDVLNASYWNNFPDGKRKRCSEILIYPKIERKYIIKLHCCSYSTLNYLSQFGIPVKISKNLFFGNCSLGTTSKFSSLDDDIPF